MKKSTFIATIATAALALAGCNKNQVTAPAADPDAGKKTVDISISGANLATKANLDPDGSYDKAAAVEKLDIYFTTATDVIQYSYRLEANGEYGNAWTAIMTDKKTVRFVGLTNVSRVYVVANSPDALLTSGNISQIAAGLDSQYGEVENTSILYAGADRSFSTIYDEPADGVGATIPGDATEESEEYSSQYVNAEVSIRPVISRLEINKIGVKTSGTETVQLNNDTYTIAWEGFAPKLYGIYMSNFYGSIAPMAPAVEKGFATPEGNKIEDGVWSDDAGIDAAYNAQNISLYSNWETGTGYDDLFASSYNHTEGDNFYYFWQDGTPATCVPFNFLVPFDVEATEASTAADVTFAYSPAFHFQFYFVPTELDATPYTIKVYEGEGTDGTEIKAEGETLDLYNQLTSGIQFNTAGSGIYYANMVKFMDESGENDVTIAPNTIYRMPEVVIDPFNLATGTVSEDSYNIIVKVTVLDYNEITVTPSFE